MIPPNMYTLTYTLLCPFVVLYVGLQQGLGLRAGVFLALGVVYESVYTRDFNNCELSFHVPSIIIRTVVLQLRQAI